MTEMKKTMREVKGFKKEAKALNHLKDELMDIMAGCTFQTLMNEYEEDDTMDQFEVYLELFVAVREEHPVLAVRYLQAMLRDFEHGMLADLIPVVCGASREEIKAFCECFLQEIVAFWCDDEEDDDEETGTEDEEEEEHGLYRRPAERD